MVTRREIIKTARSYIGTKYHHEGRLKKSDNDAGGIDCCGLIIEVAKELGLSDYNIFGYSPHADGVSLLAEFTEECEKVDTPEYGDILIFRIRHNPQHCGILGENKSNQTLIHAYQSLDAVKEHIFDAWWASRVVAAFRFPGVEG